MHRHKKMMSFAVGLSEIRNPMQAPSTNTSKHTLADLKTGQAVRITRLDEQIAGAERRRLLDMGLVPGTRVSFGMDNPMGDPIAYWVRGALIALRNSQAQLIETEAPEPNIP
jgi:ferrous iron transport protein A